MTVPVEPLNNIVEDIFFAAFSLVAVRSTIEEWANRKKLRKHFAPLRRPLTNSGTRSRSRQ